MKKLTLVLAVVAFAAVSCKKEYTCTCSTTYAGTTYSASATAEMKKKDAEAWCTAYNTGSGTTCKLD
ncbi:MAG: hypothetical protein V4667_13305 [Bacteroidota bacterium]